METVRLFVCGDLHRNERFLAEYIYPMAAEVGADAIIQVGDYGYWEHMPEGVDFLDVNAWCAQEYNIPLYWLHGNHDKHSLALKKYAEQRDPDGFMVCRPGVFYIPQGHIWTWAGVRMRAFGGAYSVDKEYRLAEEKRVSRRLWAKEEGRRTAGFPAKPVPSTAGWSWFPEEEMSDGDMTQLLTADSGPVEVIFSHDKPRGSQPGWNRKDIEECWPNQDRLERALRVHQPKLWIHGHLHWRYVSHVMCGNDNRYTEVHGLAPDDNAAERFWRPTHTWCVLDLVDGEATLTSGAAVQAQLEEKESESA